MEQPSPDDSSFGYNLAAGHDLDGDDVPDVLVTGNTGKTAFPPLVYLVSGATGEARAVPIDSDSGASPFVAWVALGDLTGDGRVEPFLGYVIGPINSNKQLNAYNHRPGPEPLDQPVYTVDWQLAGGVVFGTELCVEDVTGDGCAEVLLGSIDNTGVHIIGGSPMLLGHDYQTYAAFGERDVRRGTLARFAAVGNAEGRPVRLAASRRGNGCTFIPQLGICLDLDRPFQQIGQAVTDPDGFARFSLTVPPDTSLGPAWLQCLDINFPRRGPTTSNVMKIQIVE